jgi:YD repeat-containing protein
VWFERCQAIAIEAGHQLHDRLGRLMLHTNRSSALTRYQRDGQHFPGSRHYIGSLATRLHNFLQRLSPLIRKRP